MAAAWKLFSQITAWTKGWPYNSAVQLITTATHQHPCGCLLGQMFPVFLCQTLLLLNSLYSCIAKHSCSSLQERLRSFLAVYICPEGGLVYSISWATFTHAPLLSTAFSTRRLLDAATDKCIKDIGCLCNKRLSRHAIWYDSFKTQDTVLFCLLLSQGSQ